MPDFLELSEIEPEALRSILDLAGEMKAARSGWPKGKTDAGRPLGGIIAALIFEKPSTRTRVSFDVGVRQLGGQTMLLSRSDMQLGQGETIEDTARVISGYSDIAMIRTFDAATIRQFAQHASIPVINGLTNSSHPCQIMADIMTFEEVVGPIAGRQVAWLGAGSNVCNSLIEASGCFRFDLVFSGPKELSPSDACVQFSRSRGACIEFEPDPAEAVKNASLVVTDAWQSMHDDPEESRRQRALLKPYQVTARLMQGAPDAVFMHCLPAHRGEEVAADVIDGPRSLVFQEAENRLHAQKAILRWCLRR